MCGDSLPLQSLSGNLVWKTKSSKESIFSHFSKNSTSHGQSTGRQTPQGLIFFHQPHGAFSVKYCFWGKLFSVYWNKAAWCSRKKVEALSGKNPKAVHHPANSGVPLGTSVWTGSNVLFPRAQKGWKWATCSENDVWSHWHHVLGGRQIL